MDTHLPEYELYAVRYAERDARRSDHFIGGDPHDGPMPTDYFVWVAIAPHHTVVIDTGFAAEVAAAHKRRFPRCPSEALSLIGVGGNAVKDVVRAARSGTEPASYHPRSRPAGHAPIPGGPPGARRHRGPARPDAGA
jgi:hypothetical protein